MSQAPAPAAADRLRLDGKVVVLTGAAGILGSQVTARFLEQGARVCALDVSDEALARLPDGPGILKVAVNIAERASVAQAWIHCVMSCLLWAANGAQAALSFSFFRRNRSCMRRSPSGEPSCQEPNHWSSGTAPLSQ